MKNLSWLVLSLSLLFGLSHASFASDHQVKVENSKRKKKSKASQKTPRKKKRQELATKVHKKPHPEEPTSPQVEIQCLNCEEILEYLLTHQGSVTGLCPKCWLEHLKSS